MRNRTSESFAHLPRRKIGDQFETHAAIFLESKGYTIIERNRMYPWGEIDIIAEMIPSANDSTGGAAHPKTGQPVRTLVFVEVRGSLDHAWVSPEESLRPKKLARLKRAIETYLLYYRGNALDVRVDLITVRGEDMKHLTLQHYPNYIRLMS